MTGRPTVEIAPASALTAAVTGEGVPAVLRASGCRWQTAPRKRDGWLIPRPAIADVVRAARRLGGTARVTDPLGLLADTDAHLPFPSEVAP